MKILKIFAVCFVLLNFSLFMFVSTNTYSKSNLTNKKTTKLYDRLVFGVSGKTIKKNNINLDSNSMNKNEEKITEGSRTPIKTIIFIFIDF